MAAFHRAGRTRINVFAVGDRYLFKHYFEDEVFAEIRDYYSRYDYRFEVPESRFEHVRRLLEDRGYAPVVVDRVAEFAVAKRKYTNHPDALFEDSVFQRSVGNFNVFVMKDREAVERAVDAGARRLSETGVEFPA